jgi:hypothetical protein
VRPEDRQRALLAGYQIHPSKPIEARELIAVIICAVSAYLLHLSVTSAPDATAQSARCKINPTL